MRKKSFVAESWILLSIGLIAGLPAASLAEEAAPSLYDRLGGVYSIALVVDDFIDRVVENDILNANPNIYAARVPQRFPGLKYQLTAMVCMATGGPCNYTGKSMVEAHVGMEITETDWQALAVDLQASLDHFGVGETEQRELFAIIETTKADIVASSAYASAE